MNFRKRLDTLRYVINYQTLQLRLGELILAQETGKGVDEASARYAEAKIVVEDTDGHSGGSYYWTRDQAAIVMQFGWKKWLETPEARYGYHGLGLEMVIKTKH